MTDFSSQNPQINIPFGNIQPTQYPTYDFGQTLDRVMNQAIQYKVAQTQLQNAQAEQNINASMFGLTPQQLANPQLMAQGANYQPQRFQGPPNPQAIDQSLNQPIPPQPGSQEATLSHINQMLAMRRLGVQYGSLEAGAKAGTAQAQSAMMQNAAIAQAKDLGLTPPIFFNPLMPNQQAPNQVPSAPSSTMPPSYGPPGTQSQVNTIPDVFGNQYIRTFDPQTGIPKYEKVSPNPSTLNPLTGQRQVLPPGTEVKAPPGAEEGTKILTTARDFMPLLDRYEQDLQNLPVSGRLGKLSEIWNTATGSLPEYQKAKSDQAILQMQITPFLETLNRLNPAEAEAAQKALAGLISTPGEAQASISSLRQIGVDKIRSAHSLLQGNIMSDPVINSYLNRTDIDPQNQQAQQIQKLFRSGQISRTEAKKRLASIK